MVAPVGQPQARAPRDEIAVAIAPYLVAAEAGEEVLTKTAVKKERKAKRTETKAAKPKKEKAVAKVKKTKAKTPKAK